MIEDHAMQTTSEQTVQTTADKYVEQQTTERRFH
jgi:hypothetical protein